MNANQVFYWRKLFREGRLDLSLNPQLLAVKVETERPAEAVKSVVPTLAVGTMEIAFPKGTIRIAGSVDVLALRVVLESLPR